MVTQSAQPMNLINGQEQYRSALERQSPPWLAALRQQGWVRFSELGFPTVKHEEWKYTSLTPVSAHRYSVISAVAARAAVPSLDFLGREDINLVFLNGVLNKELSRLAGLPAGLTVLNLTEAAQKHEALLKDLLAQTSPNDPEPFVSLNNALFSDGVFIGVAEKAAIAPLIHVCHITTGEADDTIAFPRAVIHLGRSAQASVLESFIGLGAKRHFTNAVTDIYLSDNAVLLHGQSQAEGPQSFHINATRIRQERDSQVETFSLAIGALINRNNLSVISEGPGTGTVLNGLYAISGTQQVDNHTLVDHQQPNCTSRQLYKGILNDSARAVFNGKIFVRPEAQQTNSYQLNKNLLLGNDCRVDTKPQLEISADDVKCTHGATIGQLDEEEVFYLQTRCIPKAEAVRMLSRGFVDDVLNTITNPAARAQMSRLLYQKFSVLQ